MWVSASLFSYTIRATPSTTETSSSPLCSKGWGNWGQTWLALAPVFEKVFNGLPWHISYPPQQWLCSQQRNLPQAVGPALSATSLHYMGNFTHTPGCSWSSSTLSGQGPSQLALQDFCPSFCGCRFVSKSASERAESSRSCNDAPAGSELNSCVSTGIHSSTGVEIGLAAPTKQSLSHYKVSGRFWLTSVGFASTPRKNMAKLDSVTTKCCFW